jgi:hypothetical protein
VVASSAWRSRAHPWHGPDMVLNERPSSPLQNLRRVGLLVGITLAVLGCGAGGSAQTNNDGSTSCSARFSPGATMSWQDDGTPECADLVSATYDAASATTIFSIIGSKASGLGVGFGVSTTTGGLTIGGTYPCGASGSFNGTFSYQQGSTDTFASTCSITVNSPDGAGGAPTTGIFSATLTLSGGATKTISNGVFSAPVSVVGG